MTTTSTFFAMVMLPLNTLLYVHLVYGSDAGEQVALDWSGVVLALVLVNTGASQAIHVPTAARDETR